MSASAATSATYYDLLRVERSAPPEGVRRAYRRLAQRYHPDKMQGRRDAEQVMAALNEAYAVLSDPQRRARYDHAIARAPGAPRDPLPEVREPAWPWWLIFGTVSFAVAAIGTVAWRVAYPSVTLPAAHLASQPK